MSFVTIVILVAVVVIGFRLLMGKAIKTSAATRPVGAVETFTYTGKSGVLLEQFSKMGMERHINLMITNGWEVVNQTGLPGHVRLGRTLTGAALTGGLSLLAGGSRTADRVTITYRRVQVPAAPPIVHPPLATVGQISPERGVDSTGDLSCPKCDTRLPSDAMFCRSCGTSMGSRTLAASTKACHNCGSQLGPDATFCSKCGARLSPAALA